MLFFYLQPMLVNNEYQKLIVIEGTITGTLVSMTTHKSFSSVSPFKNGRSGCTTVLVHSEDKHILTDQDIPYLYQLLRSHSYTIDKELTTLTMNNKSISPDKHLLLIAYPSV